MKAMLYRLAFTIAKLALKALLSSDVKTTLYDAIHTAERSGEQGEGKMRVALDHIKRRGPDILRHQAETHLRTLVELALDRLV